MKHFSGFFGSSSRRQLFAMWERVSILVWNMGCNDMDRCCMTKVSQDACKPGNCHMYEKRRRFGERKNQGGVGERTKLKAKKNSPIPLHLICTCPQLPALYAWQRLVLSLNEPFTGTFSMCPRYYVQTAPLSRERCHLLNVCINSERFATAV